jgi:hypothetical protein
MDRVWTTGARGRHENAHKISSYICIGTNPLVTLSVDGRIVWIIRE